MASPSKGHKQVSRGEVIAQRPRASKVWAQDSAHVSLMPGPARTTEHSAASVCLPTAGLYSLLGLVRSCLSPGGWELLVQPAHPIYDAAWLTEGAP